jgi:hypothetical protein
MRPPTETADALAGWGIAPDRVTALTEAGVIGINQHNAGD